VKLVEVPVQTIPPVLVKDGVTVIVATIGAEVLLVAVKDEISPVPLAAKPIDGESLVQLYTVPGNAPVKAIAEVLVPLHNGG